jgi:acetoin utilization deacetylase AcuC-like enzyme
MFIYYSPLHKKHNPSFEIYDGGEKVPNFEVPERAEQVLSAFKQTDWATILQPSDFGLDPILAVHDADYINFLRCAYAEWQHTATDTDYEKTELLPATFPSQNWHHRPATLLGRAGFYMHDLSAPITDGTYLAALSSVNCALSSANAITNLAKTSFAICRPPGHHAGNASCAGYCYINNAAVAANWLTTKGRIAILDIDYHAGNGTQEIFYQRADVLTISIHADPDHEYPYFSGYEDEKGEGPGLGYHHNFPMPSGTDDAHYLPILGKALDLVARYSPEYFVISAGMDLFEGDPLGNFEITKMGIRQIGREIANLNLKNLVVLEGGYNNAALGENIVTFMDEFRLKDTQ